MATDGDGVTEHIPTVLLAGAALLMGTAKAAVCKAVGTTCRW